MTQRVGMGLWIISDVFVAEIIVLTKILDSLAKTLKKFSATNARRNPGLKVFPCAHMPGVKSKGRTSDFFNSNLFKIMELKTNGDYNRVQINYTEDRTGNGELIKKGWMLNIREDSPQKAYALYTELKAKIEGKENQQEEKADQEKSEIPSCPKCGKAMILRQNGKKGDYFWGCSTYPSCKGTRQRKDSDKADEIPVLDF